MADIKYLYETTDKKPKEFITKNYYYGKRKFNNLI